MATFIVTICDQCGLEHRQNTRLEGGPALPDGWTHLILDVGIDKRSVTYGSWKFCSDACLGRFLENYIEVSLSGFWDPEDEDDEEDQDDESESEAD